jgi:hypothetical protein
MTRTKQHEFVVTITRSDHPTIPDPIRIYAKSKPAAVKFIKEAYRSRLLDIISAVPAGEDNDPRVPAHVHHEGVHLAEQTAGA